MHDEGIKKEDLQGLEIQGKHTAYVVFKTFGTRNKFLNKKITARGQRLILDHPNLMFNRQHTTLVHVYNYPIDGETHNLTTVLYQYGKRTGDVTIVNDSYGLATGERTIVMEIKKDIPSYVFVGKHQVRIRYYQQPQTCLKCYKTGHIARDCIEDATCRECGATDHTQRKCYSITVQALL